MLAGDPTTRDLLNETNIPTLYKVIPTDGTDVEFLRGLKLEYEKLPGVFSVTLAEEQLDLISKLQGFVSVYTTGLWIALMFASGLLIWNTIRTAMFARRREIEVMKLVGATDWFIRLPFMLEGLVQGLLGGLLAVVTLQFINWRWTIGVEDFPDSSGMTALVVVDGYQWTVAIYILAFGALVGHDRLRHRRLPLPRRLIDIPQDVMSRRLTNVSAIPAATATYTPDRSRAEPKDSSAVPPLITDRST